LTARYRAIHQGTVGQVQHPKVVPFVSSIQPQEPAPQEEGLTVVVTPNVPTPVRATPPPASDQFAGRVIRKPELSKDVRRVFGDDDPNLE
jgi:hypothetical protein